jgi:hypothetical protein
MKITSRGTAVAASTLESGLVEFKTTPGGAYVLTAAK